MLLSFPTHLGLQVLLQLHFLCLFCFLLVLLLLSPIYTFVLVLATGNIPELKGNSSLPKAWKEEITKRDKRGKRGTWGGEGKRPRRRIADQRRGRGGKTRGETKGRRQERQEEREGRDYNHIKEEEGKRRNGNEGKGKGGIWKKRERRREEDTYTSGVDDNTSVITIRASLTTSIE